MQNRTDTQLPITQTGAINTLVDARPARPVLTIICPVHNEAKVIPLFYNRMRPVMDELSKDYTVNLVFSNNASSDATLEVIESIRKEAKDVFVVSLAANVGYQRSL